MDNNEAYGMNLDGALSEGDMGHSLDDFAKPLHELFADHRLWIKTRGAKGKQLDLSGYDLRNVPDLRRHPMTAIRCVKGILLSQDLSAADMQSAVFDESDFRDCDLNSADVRGSSFQRAKLMRADLRNLKASALVIGKSGGKQSKQRTDFSGADMRYCDLNGASFKDCKLIGADFRHARLQNVDFRGADLTGAELESAVMDGMKLEGATLAVAGFRRVIHGHGRLQRA